MATIENGKYLRTEDERARQRQRGQGHNIKDALTAAPCATCSMKEGNRPNNQPKAIGKGKVT
jgi:hypothetical protein